MEIWRSFLRICNFSYFSNIFIIVTTVFSMKEITIIKSDDSLFNELESLCTQISLMKKLYPTSFYLVAKNFWIETLIIMRSQWNEMLEKILIVWHLSFFTLHKYWLCIILQAPGKRNFWTTQIWCIYWKYNTGLFTNGHDNWWLIDQKPSKTHPIHSSSSTCKSRPISKPYTLCFSRLLDSFCE